jgi:hypothetical protein
MLPAPAPRVVKRYPGVGTFNRPISRVFREMGGTTGFHIAKVAMRLVKD